MGSYENSVNEASGLSKMSLRLGILCVFSPWCVQQVCSDHKYEFYI